MYDFLNLLPLVRELLNFAKVPLQNLINSFILFDEDKQQIMSSLSDFSLKMRDGIRFSLRGGRWPDRGHIYWAVFGYDSWWLVQRAIAVHRFWLLSLQCSGGWDR